MYKKSRILLALTLVIILSVGLLSQVALASDPPPRPLAAITKVLKMPIGTNLPTGSFTFTFTPLSINEDPSLTPPAIAAVTIAFPTGATSTTCACAVPCAPDVVHYYKESNELFGNINWPHTGVFEYNLKENANSFGAMPAGENMVYSIAEYTVKVHVMEYKAGDTIPPGKAIGDLYVYTVAAYRTVKEDGTPGTDKVDPTPGGNQTTYFYSQMKFDNIYTKHNGGNGTDPVGRNTQSIVKAVAGAYSSTSIYFDFSVTVTKPSLVPGTPVYKAYIVENGYGLTNIAANGLTASGSDVGGAYVNVNSGTALNFKLKHGQYLAFTNTHVGSSYIVSETGTAGYIPSAIVTTNNVPGGMVTGTRGSNLALPDGTIYTILRVGELLNRAAFTNTNDRPPETGLNINDLPFYGLLILAAGGIAALVIVKTRSRKTNR